MLLLTGATGFIGSALLQLAMAQGRAVRAVVRDAARAAALPTGVDVAVADLDDVAALERAARGCSGVLHVAGTVGGTPEQTRAVNVEGTRAVLAAAVAAGVPRFVLTSSGAAIIDATGLVTEHPTNPPAMTDPYSLSKSAAEELVLAAAADGLGATIVNPVSVYGPSPAGPLSYNSLFLSAARGEIAEVVDAPVGWLLAADAAAGHLLALDHGRPGSRYVLCGEVAPFGRMLNTFARLVGGRQTTTLAPGSALGPGAGTWARRSEVYGNLPPVRIDDAGARALGFAPRSVDEGLAETAAWVARLGIAVGPA